MLKIQHNLYALSYAESVQVIDVKLKIVVNSFYQCGQSLGKGYKKKNRQAGSDI